MCSSNRYAIGWTAVAFALAVTACGGEVGSEGSGSELSGVIEIDGSSTVLPITEAVAEEFGLETGGSVQVNVGQSGTGGGFKRFCGNETAISNASRTISESERQLCTQNGVEFVEIQVALDGIAITVNPENDFAECVTVAELKKIWEPNSTVRRWSDIRSSWPAQEIRLYGPGTNSGTFDYFTEAIVGETGASRADYTASEDDNVLVQGVEGDRQSLGYFGYAYYEENQQRLKNVAVDAGNGCVKPDPQTIRSAQYAPLSRPLFIYVNREAMARPEVQSFVRFYLEHGPQRVPVVGYVPMDSSAYQTELAKLGPGGSAAH
ncbi:MAG: PstS family phosphate ABC transporter substrate-binding protein [Longimicrobiales bacterium]